MIVGGRGRHARGASAPGTPLDLRRKGSRQANCPQCLPPPASCAACSRPPESRPAAKHAICPLRLQEPCRKDCRTAWVPPPPTSSQPYLPPAPAAPCSGDLNLYGRGARRGAARYGPPPGPDRPPRGVGPPGPGACRSCRRRRTAARWPPRPACRGRTAGRAAGTGRPRMRRPRRPARRR